MCRVASVVIVICRASTASYSNLYVGGIRFNFAFASPPLNPHLLAVGGAHRANHRAVPPSYAPHTLNSADDGVGVCPTGARDADGGARRRRSRACLAGLALP